MRVGAICGPRLPAGHGPPGGCLFRWALMPHAAPGGRKDPPRGGRRGPLPRRPAGATASKAELKASVLLSGPETADSQALVSARGPFRAHSVIEGAAPLRTAGTAPSICDLLDAERLGAALGAAVVGAVGVARVR